MGTIVSAMATSHAFTFQSPDSWDSFREKNRQSYRNRRGKEPSLNSKLAEETLERNEERFERISSAHKSLMGELIKLTPDALILIGDDQNEVFSGVTQPQIAIYVGPDFTLSRRFATSSAVYTVNVDIADQILKLGAEAGIKIQSIQKFEGDILASHAHAQVLDALLPNGTTPVVLVFVNAVHYPALEPGSCYELGQLIGRVIKALPASNRITICASGGLSHFTAGYPWDNYDGPYSYGDISEDFDRKMIDAMDRGAGEELAKLSGTDLLTHGNIELRTWIVLLGAIGRTKPNFIIYEPFYRAIMGMAVASWPESSN